MKGVNHLTDFQQLADDLHDMASEYRARKNDPVFAELFPAWLERKAAEAVNMADWQRKHASAFLYGFNKNKRDDRAA